MNRVNINKKPIQIDILIYCSYDIKNIIWKERERDQEEEEEEKEEKKNFFFFKLFC